MRRGAADLTGLTAASFSEFTVRDSVSALSDERDPDDGQAALLRTRGRGMLSSSPEGRDEAGGRGDVRSGLEA